jgi:hypothetical protein
MNSSIKVLNPKFSEFNWSTVKVNSKYNILLHCVNDPVNNFEEEFAFLSDAGLDSSTLVILWHAVEIGPWNQSWIDKLNNIVNSANYKLVYVTGCSHKLNLSDIFDIKFDIRFLPVFDIRSKDIWLNYRGPRSVSVDKDKKYMCINAKDEWHRRFMLGNLIRNDLIDAGVVSYQCSEGVNTFDLPTVQDILDTCLPYIPMKLANRFRCETEMRNFAGFLDRDLFLNSYVNLVGETIFSNRNYNTSFVTEKTFNAIANNQMFIIVGQAGSLDLLHSLGYQTFSSIIDESYDNILDNDQRLVIVTEEILRFISRPIESIRKDYIKVKDIIDHNRDLLYKQTLDNRLQNLLDQLDK